ncbi:hypothetical protein FHG87_017029 [Trinorchestia longiramus]|nr:hypothetical protein FHG87_017029 [Trinorchestia longiramus]
MFCMNVMAWNGGDREKLEVLQNRVGRLALVRMYQGLKCFMMEVLAANSCLPSDALCETFTVERLLTLPYFKNGHLLVSSSPAARVAYYKSCKRNQPQSLEASLGACLEILQTKSTLKVLKD